MNGRLYDPQIGRMLSPDIIVQDPSNTQAFNRFSYVMNNPLKFNDPNGYYPIFMYAINGSVSFVSMTAYIHFIPEVTVHAFKVYHGENSSPANWIDEIISKYNSRHSWMISYQNGSAGGTTGGIPGDMIPGSLYPMCDGSISITGQSVRGGGGISGGNSSVISGQSFPIEISNTNSGNNKPNNINSTGEEGLTYEQAKFWFQFGEGRPLYVNINTIDFSRVSMRDLSDGLITVELDNPFKHMTNINDALVYGTLTLQRVKDNIYRAAYVNEIKGCGDKYDFNIEWLDLNAWFFRNEDAMVGGIVNRFLQIGGSVIYIGGKSFPIYLKGTVTIKR